jgi:hypothetical protein
MVLSLDQVGLLDRLEHEVRFAARPSSGLFSKLVAGLCNRISALDRAGRTGPIGPLLEMQAWTEAALALIASDLPAWQVRRMVHDGAEWMCSLARQPYLPLGLDDSVEATHESLPLAILMAFLEARRRTATLPQAPTTTSQCGDWCCETARADACLFRRDGVAEWRKLLAQLSRAVAGERRHRAAIEHEAFCGHYRLASKIDNDLSPLWSDTNVRRKIEIEISTAGDFDAATRRERTSV